jgi:hypothetical protein
MVNAYLGPSLGWVNTYVRHTRTITTMGIAIVNPGDSIIILDVDGPLDLMLPSTHFWLHQPVYRPATAFDRSLIIKMGNLIFNVRLIPFGFDTIDTIPGPLVLSTPLQSIQLLPVEGGWLRG